MRKLDPTWSKHSEERSGVPFVIAVKRLSADDVGGEDCAKKKKVVDRLLSDRRGGRRGRSGAGSSTI